MGEGGIVLFLVLPGLTHVALGTGSVEAAAGMACLCCTWSSKLRRASLHVV